MKKSQRMKVLVDLQARQEHEALEALGISQKKLQDQQAQLENLQNYRVEYLGKFAVRQQAGINVSQFTEFRAFVDKLDKAIEGQLQTVTAHERGVQRARKHWEELHQRTKSLQKVSDLALVEEMKVEQKREQAEQDDRAARSGRRDGTGSA
ncbi:flagellar export protein FliJ [Methylomonas montana]|uniref:flagellar export protein FliJ n=1 Tax=Methylomonas montana TaxID=3058963 RepID=UPI002659D03D|nr:flagellar export protein FliJ [Methylomonas montana]WKJ91838.1 flagellar export protein FliJ [Methylomonas montana]